MMQKLVGIFRTSSDLEEAIGHIGVLRKRWTKVRSAARRPTTRAGTWCSSCATCWSAPRRWRAARCSERRAAAPTRAWTIRAWTPSGASATTRSRSDGDEMRVEARPLSEMPDDLRSLITT